MTACRYCVGAASGPAKSEVERAWTAYVQADKARDRALDAAARELQRRARQ